MLGCRPNHPRLPSFLFTAFAKKCKSNRATNELIPELEKAWLTTVSDLLDQYISSQYMVHHDIGRMLPARKFCGAETRKHAQVDLSTVWTLIGLCLLKRQCSWSLRTVQNVQSICCLQCNESC